MLLITRIDPLPWPGRTDVMQVYNTPAELWESVAQGKNGNQVSAKARDGGDGEIRWYSSAVAYWDAQAPTDDGVLGGYGFVSDIDVRDSRAFLKNTLGERVQEASLRTAGSELVALDCGAGVGRVSAELLLHICHEVDLVEPCEHLLKAAKERLLDGKKNKFPQDHRAVGFFQSGLETFDPQKDRYDIIWIQWAMLYLTDEDAIAFLRRCSAALKPGGIIFIKENVCAEGFIVDSEDASVTRSHAYNVDLFTGGAGLRLLHTALQKGFPKHLFKVRMYALARQ